MPGTTSRLITDGLGVVSYPTILQVKESEDMFARVGRAQNMVGQLQLDSYTTPCLALSSF